MNLPPHLFFPTELFVISDEKDAKHPERQYKVIVKILFSLLCPIINLFIYLVIAARKPMFVSTTQTQI